MLTAYATALAPMTADTAVRHAPAATQVARRWAGRGSMLPRRTNSVLVQDGVKSFGLRPQSLRDGLRRP
jgi:hypothetical protein